MKLPPVRVLHPHWWKALTNRAHASSYPPPIFCRKAEAARPESQDARAQGREALFASSEGAKRPEILAARAGQRFSLNLWVGDLTAR